MKVLKMLLIVAGVMLLATAASAQYCKCEDTATIPNQGYFSTYAGTLLPGRVSEGWCGTPVNGGVPGNTEDAMSWDGATLGGQWHVWGMAIDAAGAGETGRSIDATGTGWIDYVTNYEGGQFWLDGAHFGTGAMDFTGTIDYYNVGTRITLLYGAVVGVTSNVTFNGRFAECDCCYIEFAIANAMRVWVDGQGTILPDYPAFFCGTTGELFDACCILASISCPVGTEETSWGAIKEMHK
jgi:hypothetical protein